VSPRRARSGFTMVEMVVVLLIIAIGTAVVVPMIEGGFDSREVRRAAREIAATMHHCRVEAVSTGEPQELIIDPYQNAIATTDWGRWAVLTDRAIIERVEGGFETATGAVQIVFYPNGSSSGADVTLASRRDRTRMRLRVRLDPLVSRVDVDDAPA
jgi:general secretion pathway protein H